MDIEDANQPVILLVDDSIQERDLYEVALSPEFAVLTASRGSEGASLAQRVQPDAVVLDVMMPGMDGWDTCTHIKSHAATAHIPVILLTGTDSADLSQHAAAVGASALLRKPCSLDVLRTAILAVLHATPPFDEATTIPALPRA